MAEPLKINRRSAHITEGTARAPNRSMYYALGYQEGDFKKPMIVEWPLATPIIGLSKSSSL